MVPINGNEAAPINAIILAGGLGTRLRGVVPDRPKVLANVAGRPFLTRLLDQLADAGVEAVTLSTGYKAELVESEIGPERRGMPVSYAREMHPLGTGGALRLALEQTAGDPFLALNGDSYCAVDLAALREFHLAAKAAATLTLARVPDTSRFGRVETGEGGAVLRFEEKGGKQTPGWINAGVYCVSREVIESLRAGVAISLEREVFPALIGKGLHAFPGGGRFIDIGTPESYAEAQRFFRLRPVFTGKLERVTLEGVVISRTPFRISFFGGGTDYPAWYRENGGAVLATTIDKYCYLTVRHLPPFFEHRIRVVYSKIENCNHVEEIQHPAVRETLQFMKMSRGVEIHHDGDLPARSGMGSSSSFTVGLIHALHALKAHMPGKEQLAREALYVEQERLQEAVGSQDQIQAAYGGFNQVTFAQNGEFSVKPMILPAKRMRALTSSLMLFYTGIKRTASDVASSFVNNLQERKVQLHKMRALVDDAVALLTSRRDIDDFGRLMNEGWLLKRSLSAKISNPTVEDIYERSLAAGALGGKLTGAGGGGFLLLFVPPSRRLEVRQALASLIHVPFEFEFSGSQIIFYDVEQDYAAEERSRAAQALDHFRELAEIA